MKKKIKNNTNHSTIQNNNKPSFIKKIKSNIQDFLMNMPDAHWTWVNPAIKKANELIEKNNIKLFYTTTNPNSVLKIGNNIKNQNNILWVSDFRDPIGYIDRYKTHNKYFQNYDMNIIKNAMKTADFITGLASSYEEIFINLYNIKKDKFKFVPTGLDNQYISNLNNETTENYLLFSGEFLIEYGEYFFKVFNTLIENENFKNLKIYFVGRKEINEPMVLNILKEIPNTIKNLTFIDHIPQLELYKLIANAKGCLLVAGFDSRWYCNYAKMVDYIALNKPVITVVPKKSEARQELDKANLGLHLTGKFDEDIELLSNFLNKKDYDNLKDDYYKTYLASSQVKSFAEIFDNLLGIKNGKK